MNPLRKLAVVVVALGCLPVAQADLVYISSGSYIDAIASAQVSATDALSPSTMP